MEIALRERGFFAQLKHKKQSPNSVALYSNGQPYRKKQFMGKMRMMMFAYPYVVMEKCRTVIDGT